jgi:SHS family lactate transporter-like MFS transporter
MYPTFLKVERGFSAQTVAKIAVIYNVGALIGGIAFGLVSDRYGRRFTMITVAPAGRAGHSALGLRADRGGPRRGRLPPAVHGARGLGRDPRPHHGAEPDSVRGFLPGFAYQCGVLLAGSVAYVEAVFAQRTSYANAMALTAVTVFLLAAVVAARGPERRAARFGD